MPVAADLLTMIQNGTLGEGTVLHHRARGRTGRSISATVVAGGIKFSGKVYSTPSGAARAITKVPVQGWTFWRLPNGDQLVTLRPKAGS